MDDKDFQILKERMTYQDEKIDALTQNFAELDRYLRNGFTERIARIETIIEESLKPADKRHDKTRDDIWRLLAILGSISAILVALVQNI